MSMNYYKQVDKEFRRMKAEAIRQKERIRAGTERLRDTIALQRELREVWEEPYT